MTPTCTAVRETDRTMQRVDALIGSLDALAERSPVPCFDAPAREAATRLVEVWSARDDGPLPQLVVTATRFAVRAHAGQRRRSGELYVSHPLLVAAAVAEAGFDEASIAAAVCHDVVEDCAVTVEELAAATSPEVAHLVDGVSKVDKVHFPSALEAEAASMTKFLVAVTDDVRVLAIKLADRLHNLRTAAALRPDRQARMAREALEVFSPLAHRLGMENLRREMEDLAFELADPEAFRAVADLVATVAPDADRVGEQVASVLAAGLADLDPPAVIYHRVKHLYSVHNKLRRDSVDGALHDLVGVRVVVGSVADCYRALGVVHTHFTPVPRRFKDMVAVPKSNGYQSLHTTVRVDGHDTEVQIRTREMHARAQFGIAAHYTYKQGGRQAASGRGHDDALAEAWQASATPEEFLERLRSELAPESEVVVLTPAGRPIVMPAGACAIDVAYKVHTEVGHRCIGAKADGRLIPIRSPLWTGAVVEIVTSDTPAPKRDWLRACKTPQARAKIRRFFAEAGTVTDQASVGADMLTGELRRRGVAAEALEDQAFTERLARLNQQASFDLLCVSLADGSLKLASVRGLPAVVAAHEPAALPRTEQAAAAQLAGLPFVVARCCNPTPGDESAGFVSASRVVSVHRVDCPNYQALVRSLPADSVGRLTPFGPESDRRAWVEVRAFDRPGLLRDMSDVTSRLGVSILVATSATTPDGVICRFEFEIADADHLATICAALRTITSVVSVSSSGN